MRYLLVFTVFLLTLLIGSKAAEAARTRGYIKNNGTYVQPYFRSTPNNYKWDNYSSQGNYNPYTGRKGYKRW